MAGSECKGALECYADGVAWEGLGGLVRGLEQKVENEDSLRDFRKCIAVG